MTGIVAIFSAGPPIDAGALTRATRALAHRGAGAAEVWLDPTRSIGIGQTRRAPAPAATDPPPAFRLALDGTLYDPTDDGAQISRLYQQHGTGFAAHLRGELAVVLYDERRDLLIAARDRLGIKPLVFAHHAGALVIASEAKALIALGRPAAWDDEAFLQACVVGGPLEDRTMIAGVRQVPPGHLLIASRNHHRLVRYWDLDYPVDGDRAAGREADDRDALAAALDDAVRLRLGGTAPVACYLGGLDASTVFGFAQRHHAAPRRAFTYAIADHVTEENALAYAMAEAAGAIATPIPIRADRLPRDLAEVVRLAERPLGHIGSALLYQLGRGVRDAGYEAVLTGEGSDELFAGYAHFRRDLAVPAEVRPTGARATPATGLPRISLDAVRAALDGFVPTWLLAMTRACHGIVALLRPELAARLARGEPFASFVGGLEVTRQLRGRHRVHQAMYLWSKSVLPNQLLAVNNDAVQMAHGIECRLPFLDPRVVELSTQLPVDRLIRGDVEKYLLREAARPVLPEAIYRRPKDRVAAPEALALETRLLDELVHDTLRGSGLRSVPLFDAARVVAALDAGEAAKPALRVPLMLALTACLLHDQLGLGG